MPPDDARLPRAIAQAWVFSAKAELISGICSMLWGAMSYIEPSSIQERPTLAHLGSIAPDGAWQTVAITFGVTQIASVYFDSWAGRWISAFFLSWFFADMIKSYIVSGQAFPTSAFPISFLLLNMMAVSRYSLYILWKLRDHTMRRN